MVKTYNIVSVIWLILNIIPFPIEGNFGMAITGNLFLSLLGLGNEGVNLSYFTVSCVIFILTIIFFFYKNKSNLFLGPVICSLLVVLISLSFLFVPGHGSY